MSLENQTSADFKNELAMAVRQGVSPDPVRFPPERLAVYIRLVRNNIFGFLNRCFVVAPKYLERQQWTDLLEAFVRDGESHSPFFQDIAAEFLKFCQKNQKLPEWILALMDLEVAQLQAEVAIVAPSAAAANDDDNAPMQPNASVQLKSYDTDFEQHYPDDADLKAVGNMVIWRDGRDWIRWQYLDDIDHILLNLAAENPLSLNDLQAQLAAVMPDGDAWRDMVRARWQYWLAENVLHGV